MKKKSKKMQKNSKKIQEKSETTKINQILDINPDVSIFKQISDIIIEAEELKNPGISKSHTPVLFYISGCLTPYRDKILENIYNDIPDFIKKHNLTETAIDILSEKDFFENYILSVLFKKSKDYNQIIILFKDAKKQEIISVKVLNLNDII